MANIQKLNSFTGGGWGEKASLTLPIGATYEEILLKTNLLPEQIKRVSVTLNGDEIYILSGLELKMLEKYRGLEDNASYFCISFSDITGKTKNGVSYSALVTEINDNITLDVEISDKSGGEGAAKLPSLQAWATVSEPQPVRIIVPKIRTQTMQATAAGDNEFLNLVSGENIYLRRMHFSSDSIKSLKIYRDQIKVHESENQLLSFLAARNGRDWQNGYYHFDPIMRGFYLNSLFPTAHISELKFTVNTSKVLGSIPILVESIEVVKPELLTS